jgi:uncharacterized protein involved in outer membrane biogenesis
LKRKTLWLLPLGVLALFAVFLAALPSLVSSTAHRATIEALASSLTGRPVKIGGNLSLALFPEPELIAQQITIGGPDNEIITADSLTLDIALTALLRGRLSAQNLTLQSPRIAFPWPLPGGAAAVAPPPWLTKLHAQIANGTISVGALTFRQVNADIYTGAGGALSVAGSGSIQNQPVSVSLTLAGLDAAGAAPVTIDAQAGPAAIHMTGTFNAASALSGSIAFNTSQIAALGDLGQPANATAAIQADPEQITLTRLMAFQGDARLTGTATLALGNPILSLNLTGNNLKLPGLNILSAWSAPAIPVYVTLDATASDFAGTAVPHFAARAELSGAGANISALNAILPGNSALSLSGTIDGQGQIAGHAGLDSNDFSALLAACGAPLNAPDSWRQTSLTAKLDGSLAALQFQRLSGTLGPGYVTGTILLDRAAATPRIAGALHFDTLDLTPFVTPAAALTGAPFNADLEITAGRALYRRIRMSNLLLDASLGDHLVVRRLSAALDNGFLAASFSIAGNGEISDARAVLSLPSATPVIALLPAAWQPPAAIGQEKLAASISAAGPPNGLRGTATVTIGDFELTATPVIDLTHATATGALTLRHPSAIAALKLFDLPSGLAWPGAGSLALRTGIAITATQFGLPNLSLSFGDLTATGRLSVTNGNQVDADISADTLALPPWPAAPSVIWSALLGDSGKISLSANRVLLGGLPILGPTAANLTLSPSSDAIIIARANLAGGNLTGSISATTAPATPPSLAAKFALTGADASQLALPINFPLKIPAGTLALQANLTAAGYGPQTWAATLAGNASLSAKSGTMAGFNLAALGAALNTIPRDTALHSACLTGATPFDTLAATASIDHGLAAITAGGLQSPDGAATATGTIDIPDNFISASLTLTPAVPAPPSIGLALNGPWSNPSQACAIREALAWTSAH